MLTCKLKKEYFEYFIQLQRSILDLMLQLLPFHCALHNRKLPMISGVNVVSSSAAAALEEEKNRKTRNKILCCVHLYKFNFNAKIKETVPPLIFGLCLRAAKRDLPPI